MQFTSVFSSTVVLCVVLAGCSKKPEATTNPASPATAQQSAPASAPSAGQSAGSRVVASALPEVTKAVQSGQYESAVQTLTQLKPEQMSDAQRMQYMQAVRDTTTALLQAKQNNPAAKAAYEKLSRSATGR